MFTYYYIWKRRLLSGLRFWNADNSPLADRLSQYGCFARDGGRRCDFPISDMPDCPSVQNPVVYKALSLQPESSAAEGAVCFCYVFYCLHNNRSDMSGLLG